MSQTTAKRRILLIIIAMLLLPAVVIAAVAAIDSWITPGFQVDLYEIDESNLPQVTYKYAVTDTAAGGNALSHWTLGIGLCANNLVSPMAGAYTTPTDDCTAAGYGTSCVASEYTVVTGYDPTTGVNGIKFEDADPQLAYPQTHLFEITVSGETGRGEIPLSIKAAGNEPVGTIMGPICEPTAVSFSNASVASSGNTAFVAIAALTMLMGFATVGVWRKHGK